MTPPQQERSKPLHNFSLPCLKWGNQRTLRCVKVTDNHPYNRSSSSSSIPNGFRFQSKPTNSDSCNNQKPNSIKQNSISPDLRFNGAAAAAAKRLKVSPLLEEEKPPIDDFARPWSLRTRRAACKAPQRIEDKKVIDSPRRVLEIDSPKRNDNTSMVQRQSVEPVKDNIEFSIALSKFEIERDFMEMAMIRPPRRPKKRPRIVQKYLDSIFPGLWLSEITPDSYKVAEVPES